jgi:hypothetical protein
MDMLLKGNELAITYIAMRFVISFSLSLNQFYTACARSFIRNIKWNTGVGLSAINEYAVNEYSISSDCVLRLFLPRG